MAPARSWESGGGPGMVPPPGRPSLVLEDSEDEWVRPSDLQSCASAGLAASVFVPSVTFPSDDEGEEDGEEDFKSAHDSSAEDEDLVDAEDGNEEDLGDSDGLGEEEVETDGEWGGSSTWSFPAAAAADAVIAVTSPGPPSDASVEGTPGSAVVRSRRPAPSSPLRSLAQEDSGVRSSLFIDVPMTPPRHPNRCGVPSFEIGTPVTQEAPTDLAAWEPVDADYVKRFPLLFDVGALNQESAHSSSAPVVADVAVPEDRERRLLCDVLWASQPAWGPADLMAAERKLAKVGIESVAGLLAALSRDLDRKLAQVGKRGAVKLKALKGKQEQRSGTVRGAGAGTGRDLDCPRLEQGRLLCDALWKSRPRWTPAMLAAAQRKLAMVGIHDLASLDRALSGGLNRRLRKAGLKTFSADTIVALRRHMGAFFGRLGIEDKETAWMSSGSGVSKALLQDVLMEPPLRAVLSQSRPTWSASDLVAAERKLALIGINSVSSLAGALAGDLNQQLRAAGLKTFNPETVRELRHRLAVPPPRRGIAKTGEPAPEPPVVLAG